MGGAINTFSRMEIVNPSFKESFMNVFSILTLIFISLPHVVEAQECEAQLIDQYNRVVQVFRGSSCKENLKACRLAEHKTGLSCQRIGENQPPYSDGPQPGQHNDGYVEAGLPYEVQRMNNLEMAINLVLEDCYVLPNVSGWANQLYVRGKFAGNFQAGQDDMKLQRAIRDNQEQGVCQMKKTEELKLMFMPSLLDEAMDYTLSRNCYVLPEVSGWANQLYVNEKFAGNFDVNNENEQIKLKATLAQLLMEGQCQRRSRQEMNLLNDPYLISDFANYHFRGCLVKLNVSGWANQVFVGNTFKGNFNAQTEVSKLKNYLVALVLNGTCVSSPL